MSPTITPFELPKPEKFASMVAARTTDDVNKLITESVGMGKINVKPTGADDSLQDGEQHPRLFSDFDRREFFA